MHMKNLMNVSTAVTACYSCHDMCLEVGDPIEVDHQVEAADNGPPHPQNRDAVRYRNVICDLWQRAHPWQHHTAPPFPQPTPVLVFVEELFFCAHYFLFPERTE